MNVRNMPIINRVKSGIFYLATLAAIGFFGAVGWLLTSLPPAYLSLKSDKIRQSVTVYFTERAVPHIYAGDFQDAAFALGYLHAQNRMWQMEMQRRAGAGRLSEILGARTLSTDRFFRTLGIYRTAEASFSSLPKDVQTHLQTYADGVNHWITNRPGSLPPEFQILRHSPELWRPADSLVWGKIMGLQLSGNFRGELLRARLLTHMKPEQVDALWPVYPKNAPATVPLGDQARHELFPSLDPLSGLVGGSNTPPTGASNAWVVSGARTDTGAPILANDPHLGFAAPILWYLVKIVMPGGFVAGGTVPGVPLILAGHNESIAWGLTATQSDVQDLFREIPMPGLPGYYYAPDGPRRFAERREIIHVRGGEDIVLEVLGSRHGPIISGNMYAAPLALASTFLGVEDRTAEAIYRINRARGKSEFLAGLRAMNGFQLNFTYADRSGGIGFYAAGKVPIRKTGNGFYIRPGNTGEYDWHGFIPFDQLPHQFDPASGVVVNANNAVVGSGYPYFLSRDWAAPYRARRIKQLLDEEGQHTLERYRGIQGDSVSLMARDLVKLMTRFPSGHSVRLSRVVRILRVWDGSMDRKRPEPLIFTAWLRAFNKAVYSDELGDDFQAFWRLRPQFIRYVLTQEPAWCDRITTEPVETCDSILAVSLIQALDGLRRSLGTGDIADLQWGDRHEAQFLHPIFQNIPILSTLANLKISTDGGDFTINRGATRPGRNQNPHAHIHGPGYRAIYDLKTPGNSLYVIATGQSGNIFSRHYRDFLRPWRDLAYIRMNQTKAELGASTKFVYQMDPD